MIFEFSRDVLEMKNLFENVSEYYETIFWKRKISGYDNFDQIGFRLLVVIHFMTYFMLDHSKLLVQSDQIFKVALVCGGL